MVDLEHLAKLLPILKANGVKVCKFGDWELELAFHGVESEPTKTMHLPPTDDDKLPPDLRTDNVNSYDTLLNWSGSPTEGEVPLPGIDEQMPAHQDLTTQYKQERLEPAPP